MKPQNSHAQEDRLLDFVYGELPPLEARAVESHLEGCTRCSELLADIRGVRTTMAQLPMEPAPDAGLESLLAYAQQAARNAAEGPAPKPTWWRRWLVPLTSVAAVCLFGIVSIQVSKSVNLSPELAKQSDSVREKAVVAKSESAFREPPPAVAAPAPSPRAGPAAPPPARKDALAQAMNADGYGVSDEQDKAAQPTATMTPPPSAPPAKLDGTVLAKESSRKGSVSSSAKAPREEWSNAGAGVASERYRANDELGRVSDDSKDAYERKKSKSYSYESRDAMTQVGPLKKPRATTVDSESEGAPSEPMPEMVTALPKQEAAPADANGPVAQGDLQQMAPAQEPLRLNNSRAGSLPTGSAPGGAASGQSAPGDDFDDVFVAKKSTARREQTAEVAAAAPPPPPVAAAPMPSPSTPAASTARPEPKRQAEEPSPSELSKLAEGARRSGDRAREAQLLRRALDSGVTGTVRLGLLDRLCQAELALGQSEACNQVIQEAPGSSAAQVARKRLSSQDFEESEAKPQPSPRAGKKATKKAAEPEAPASAPAQAQ
ncbi:anti-sigma factor family protein [Hyalangium versicolor]|uniref:anti-sigma factor family protein n=1 Tax=Hyalangium versicolor TaxID=2861190 RepID=UPI001CC9D996|nr:zf-HC2 domain-containing protein [Hyalangium versicolor]